MSRGLPELVKIRALALTVPSDVPFNVTIEPGARLLPSARDSMIIGSEGCAHAASHSSPSSLELNLRMPPPRLDSQCFCTVHWKPQEPASYSKESSRLG
eukprot:750441-Hanusia_phi.AAC.2